MLSHRLTSRGRTAFSAHFYGRGERYGDWRERVLASSNAPFGLVFAHMFNPTIGKIVIAMMVIACFGSLFS
jgi:hypothetical protein